MRKKGGGRRGGGGGGVEQGVLKRYTRQREDSMAHVCFKILTCMTPPSITVPLILKPKPLEPRKTLHSRTYREEEKGKERRAESERKYVREHKVYAYAQINGCHTKSLGLSLR